MTYRKMNLPNSRAIIERNNILEFHYFDGTNIRVISRHRIGIHCSLEYMESFVKHKENISDEDIVSKLECLQYEDNRITGYGF